ncbi:hypothetical protein BGZ95_007100 [Linnemannia exigua]|uniref:Major facilitator superfamily (MFS) profile domain-containing protein n=1 Tax=Linnemannia exigua TaxID=604196 RepID=A0AAD4H804_9FUNG|nr:hypothetical protein BGZ95_007100 [Linnemannia exigua]
MAVAIVAIGNEFGYNKSQQGVILAAFFFGYIATPILGGTLSDRFGGKPVLATGGFVWTVFTLCTPLAAALGITSAVIARIGLGLGEGIAYPAVHSMIGTWIPPCERSKAVALIFGASEPSSSAFISEKEARWILQQQTLSHGHDQDALHRRANPSDHVDRNSIEHLEEGIDHIRTVSANGEPIVYRPLSSIPLEQTTSQHSESSEEQINRRKSDSSLEEGIEHSGDNTTAISPGSPQTETKNETSKTMNRWLTFRNRRRADRIVRTDSQKSPVPWKQLLTKREVWAIIISQFCNSLGFFVMQSWIPTFYLDMYGVDVGKIGFFSVLPSAIQGVMGLFAGYLGDKAIRDWNWSPVTVRRVGQSVGSFGLGVFLLLAVKLAHTATMAMILVTIGMALNGFSMIGASVYQHDFCPEHAGFIFSLGNTAGSMPAIFGVYFVGFLLDGHGANRWDVIWTTVCVFYFVGATAFVLLSTHRRFSLS